MKNIAIIFSFLMLVTVGCKRHLTHDDVEKALKTSMQSYLNTQNTTDTSKIKFTVQDVAFFEDKVYYDCQFKVTMKQPSGDTTGTMAAWISKDFVTVKRKY